MIKEGSRRVTRRATLLGGALLLVAGCTVDPPEDLLYPVSVGTVESPAPLAATAGAAAESFGSYDADGHLWRVGSVGEVRELTPVDDSFAGRCFVTFGSLRATDSRLASEQRASDIGLAVGFADSAGRILATGDAEAACDASEVERIAATIAVFLYTPLHALSTAPGDHATDSFVQVSYVDDDPALVVIGHPDALGSGAVGGGVSVYDFALSPVGIGGGSLAGEWDEAFAPESD